MCVMSSLVFTFANTPAFSLFTSPTNSKVCALKDVSLPRNCSVDGAPNKIATVAIILNFFGLYEITFFSLSKVRGFHGSGTEGCRCYIKWGVGNNRGGRGIMRGEGVCMRGVVIFEMGWGS